jgi:DNA repair protein RecN (Recombination protein N)
MLDDLELDEGQKAQREDFLRFAVDEIRSLDPRPDELEALERRRQRLRHAEELASVLVGAESALYSGDGAVVELLGRVERSLRRAAEHDEELETEADTAEELRVRTEELAHSLGRAHRDVEHDPETLAEVDERLDRLRRLVRKYGGTVESTLEARARMEEELDQLEHDEVRRADLLSALEAEASDLARACAELGRARRAAAESLEAAVDRELDDLALADAQIRFDVRTLAEPGPRGTEAAEILIRPNRGEAARPLKKIASGGELSRVLLAFKRALADRAPAQSYVFDEVDTGIGGAVAEVLGRKLREVSRVGQVICVTHLPQVAAQADGHVLVEKSPGPEGRVLTRLRRLDADERVRELARMLGGVKITDKVLSAAEEMLLGASETRRRSRRRARPDGSVR